MSDIQEEEIKGWIAKRKSVLVMDIIYGRATVQKSAASF